MKNEIIQYNFFIWRFKGRYWKKIPEQTLYNITISKIKTEINSYVKTTSASKFWSFSAPFIANFTINFYLQRNKESFRSYMQNLYTG